MNNTSAYQCDISIQISISNINYANFYIFMPLRFLLGASSHTMAFMAYTKQTKDEHGYTYQLLCTGVKIIEITFYTIHILSSYHFSGGLGAETGADWFTNCYVCMWYAARLSTFIQTNLMMLSLLLSTAMAVDRALALSMPLFHLTLRHKKHQIAAVITCICCCILCSIDLIWKFDLKQMDHTYSIVISKKLYKDNFTTGINYFRIALRIGALLVMSISYGIILPNFERRMKQVAFMTNRKDFRKDAERRRHQKTLFVIVAYQLPFMIITHSLATAAVLVGFASWPVKMCQGALLSAIATISLALADSLDVYVVFAFSRGFRDLVKAVVPCLKSLRSTKEVVDISRELRLIKS